MNVFTELTFIILIATTVSAVIRFLRQPMIISYIITGLLVGPYFLDLVESQDVLDVFAKLGVALLLFIVGLNLSPKIIKEVGKVAVITGIGQIVFTTIFGFLINYFIFHFSCVVSIYLSLALTFSSTIIILKILSDKDELQKLYAKISIGFLLVQDVIAAFILIFVSSFNHGTTTQGVLIALVLKGLILTVALFALASFILPKIAHFFAQSQELLFLFSIAWGLGLATLFYKLGFSIEIGALAAGVALAVSPYHYEISAKMRPLRDFFIILFFITLGSQMALANLTHLIWPALGLSLFVLIGNPLIVIILMAILGYRKRVMFFSGLTVAQISEFSLILIMLVVSSKKVPAEILSLITLVGLITIAGSTYLILHAHKIYPFVSKILALFERKKFKNKDLPTKKYQIILFGYNRIGYDFLKVFKDLNKLTLVVDFNPETIECLKNQKIDCFYGDAADSDFLDQLDLSRIKMIISTVPDFDTNMFLLNKIKSINPKVICLMISYNITQAEELYSVGASYVIMPHFLGGKTASSMVRRFVFKISKFDKAKNKHLKYLKQRKKAGHEHPNPQPER